MIPHLKLEGRYDMIGCIYIEEFPAWVVRKEIEETAYVVAASNYVIGVSSLAKYFGIKSGITVSRAHGLLQDLRVIPHDQSKDEWVWRSVLNKLYTLTPNIEPVKPGLVFVEHISVSDLIALCRHLNAQGGVSYNRSYAQLAAIKSAKGNVLSINEKEKDFFLSNIKPELLKLSDFPDEIIDKLPLFGLDTLKKVSELTKRHLTAQFGVQGKKLYELLHPLNEEKTIPLYSPEKWLGEKLNFDIETNNSEEVRHCLYDQLCAITKKIGSRNAGSIRVAIEWRKKKVTATRRLQRPTNDPDKLLKHAMIMFRKMKKIPAPIKTAGIALGHFSAPQSTQISMFDRPEMFNTTKNILERYPNSLIKIEEDPHNLFPEDQLRLAPIHL